MCTREIDHSIKAKLIQCRLLPIPYAHTHTHARTRTHIYIYIYIYTIEPCNVLIFHWSLRYSLRLQKSVVSKALSEGLSKSIFLSYAQHTAILSTVLTSGKTVVPPVSSAEIRFEIVGSSCDDHDGRCDQCPYA